MKEQLLLCADYFSGDGLPIVGADVGSRVAHGAARRKLWSFYPDTGPLRRERFGQRLVPPNFYLYKPSSGKAVTQKYPKPPIIEAVLHVRYLSALEDSELARIPNVLKSKYPKSKQEIDFQLQVEVRPSTGETRKPPAPKMADRGARLISEDDHRQVITRRASTLLAYLPPYEGWEVFAGAAHFVFDTLRNKLGFRPIKSIGLRYRNRIDVPAKPGTVVVPGDYLLTGPAMPDVPIFETTKGFQATTEMMLNHDALVARIQSATLVPALIDHASLLLDIDIIAQKDLPAKQDEFWALVGRMRNDKNAIFENCVTDRARELFGWKDHD